MSELGKHTDSTVKNEPSNIRPKRKKTSRACNHCHKAHMTCDTGRPCKRCIQRGLHETCEDAPRKRKKYLADVPTNALSNAMSSVSPPLAPENEFSSQSEGNPSLPLVNNVYPQSNSTMLTYDKKETMSQPLGTTLNFAPTNGKRTNFLSSAADLEYSQLSNILHEHTSSTDESPASMNISPLLSPHTMASRTSTSEESQGKVPNYFLGTNGQRRRLLSYQDSQYPKYDDKLNQYSLGPNDGLNQSFPEIIAAIEASKEVDPVAYHERISKLAVLLTIGIATDDNGHSHVEPTFREPEEIYSKVITPFSYTPGFHSLISYLRSRFPKEMLVKMAESMAAYRPSFIACTSSLKECDLIFMEQCFQRTLLTYDNFIRVSGTPTIVWRRTGEIAYVGDEFCILTGWSKEELMCKGRKFIVELLDDKSVVEYFQLFLKIAFGDFLGATMTECTLLTPQNNVKIRTSCIWTLKRDVFGIPMMIIGNFLPII